MKKSDLKSGMLVESKNGNIYLVINDTFVRNNGYGFLTEYNDDLTNNQSDYDIMRVSGVLKGYQIKPEYWTKETLNNNLLWERNKCSDITSNQSQPNLSLLTKAQRIQMVKDKKIVIQYKKESHNKFIWFFMNELCITTLSYLPVGRDGWYYGSNFSVSNWECWDNINDVPKNKIVITIDELLAEDVITTKLSPSIGNVSYIIDIETTEKQYLSDDEALKAFNEGKTIRHKSYTKYKFFNNADFQKRYLLDELLKHSNGWEIIPIPIHKTKEEILIEEAIINAKQEWSDKLSEVLNIPKEIETYSGGLRGALSFDFKFIERNRIINACYKQGLINK